MRRMLIPLKGTLIWTTLLLVVLFSGGAHALEVSECGTLTESVTLVADIKTSGTCFTIGADNIVLDGNGHTISWG